MESQQGGGQCSHWQNWWFIFMIGDMEFHGIPSRKDHFLGKPNHEVSIWIYVQLAYFTTSLLHR